jgi:ketosteroid isomerase-like protein
MAEMSKGVVERFWKLMDANDFRAAGELLHDQYILEWPQSGERVKGREHFVAINTNYPVHGRWHVAILRLVSEGDEVVSEVNVTDDGDVNMRAITFSTVRDGRILRQREFWPEPFEPAAWRAQWVERMT